MRVSSKGVITPETVPEIRKIMEEKGFISSDLYAWFYDDEIDAELPIAIVFSDVLFDKVQFTFLANSSDHAHKVITELNIAY